MSQNISAVVLAAGASKRMKSQRSKVLHPLAGRPLLHYPVLAAAGAGASQVIVVASPSNQADVEQCLSSLSHVPLEIAIQEEPRGTGHAAQMALPGLRGDAVLLLCGDTPLITSEHLRALIYAHEQDRCLLSLLSCLLDEPHGYGRVLRNASGSVIGIREQRDLNADQLALREVNAGIYYGASDFFKTALSKLTNHNAQGEYYATDVVEMAAKEQRVLGVQAEAAVLQGINDRVQLDQLEQLLFERIINRHRRAGVTIEGGARVDDTVQIGADSTIRAGVVLRGCTTLGIDCEVDTGSIISDSTLADGVHVKPYCVITESSVGPKAELGPFAHLRPGSDLGPKVKIGNFVETKQAKLHEGAKANHLAYLGDVDVGAGANIGAGTIVCNYDGFSKARTSIGPGAFIGSDSQLVAPVVIGEGAYVATGTTVVADVPAQSLAISRTTQVNKAEYAHKLRARLAALALEKKATKAG